MRVVEELPTIGLGNIVYMVGAGKNLYEQWIFSRDTWHKVGSILVEMSEADEFFEELGYKLHSSKSGDRFDLYSKVDDELLTRIVFNKTTKRIEIYCYGEALDMQELKAINKKCEELRME